MIHMRVGEQNRVYTGKIAHMDAGMPLAAQKDKARREDRVDEQCAPGDLEQERRVPDEGNRSLLRRDRHWFLLLALYRLRVALANQTPQLLQLRYPERNGHGSVSLIASVDTDAPQCEKIGFSAIPIRPI